MECFQCSWVEREMNNTMKQGETEKKREKVRKRKEYTYDKIQSQIKFI